MGLLTSKAAGEKFKTFVIVLMLIAGVCYAGWLLIDDLASYGYEAAHATATDMTVKSRSSKNGDEIIVKYSFVVGEKSYSGENLFGPAASQRAHYFAMETFTGWYADWRREPVVYYDASNPERSRMVVGLTSSLGVVFVPCLLLGGTVGWLLIKRMVSTATEIDKETSMLHVTSWGGGGFIFSAVAGQAIFFTKLWVEEGWLLHLAVTIGTAGGLVFGFWRAACDRRDWMEMESSWARMEADLERHRAEYEREEARKAARRR